MTITRKQIERMRCHARIRIVAGLEEMILATYGVETDGPEYTEQDLYEQTRKLIDQYNHEHPDPDLADNPAPWADDRNTPQAGKKQRRDQYIQNIR